MEESAATKPPKQPTWKINCKLLVQECAEYPNPYLRDFASSPLANAFLTDDRVGSSFGKRNRSCIRKELLEAAALESRLKRIYNNNSGDATGIDGDNVVIWDLCCGKGYSAIWLTKNTYPNAKIHMVDIDKKIKRDYLDCFPNLTYHFLDIYASELEGLILDSKLEKEGVKVILVGIHLCGDLSRRALELQSKCGADATFLSPCCTVRKVGHHKRKPGSFGYNVCAQARQLKVLSSYELWCWMLWGYANSSHPDNSNHRRLDLSCDPCMKTDKNVWLTVVDTKPAIGCPEIGN